MNKLLESHGDADGFEGNAQTFRIITKLAVRFEECGGLDLTRATLVATLKYPWTRDKENPNRRSKWSVYTSETDDFLFTRQGLAHSSKTAEAELMDWADDIAYSVHDLEDFHRCGAIPWRLVFGEQRETIIKKAANAWFDAPLNAEERLRDAMSNLNAFIKGGFGSIFGEPYTGERHQRRELRNLTSELIGRYIKAAKLRETSSDGKSVSINQEEADEVLILKQITKEYVINNPSLAAQQKGQEKIINELFKDLHADASSGIPSYLPSRFKYLYEITDKNPARFAADCISSLTESEAIGLYARLQGLNSGSVLDPIVR